MTNAFGISFGSDYDNVVDDLGPSVVTLATVKPERVEWLWSGRLPVGKLVVLDGDPAVGKSTIATSIAAVVSVGGVWPDGSRCECGDVLILSAEDGLADTIRPRLDAAGGDPARVHALTEIRYLDDEGNVRARPATLGDLGPIRQAIARHAVRLVVVDVLMAYLPGRVDSHRDQDVRSVLSGLAALADDTGCTILLLRHLNKASGGNPLYRGGGSIGIVGAARAAMLAAVDPDDETRRVLAVTKSNLAAMPDALAYRLVDSPDHGCAHVVWDGTSDRTAADLLARHDDDEERGERDEAADWLIDYLRDRGGEATAKDVFAAARAERIAERTLKRARQRAGVSSERRGFGQGAVWSLTPSGPHSGRSGQPLKAGPNGLNGGPIEAHPGCGEAS